MKVIGLAGHKGRTGKQSPTLTKGIIRSSYQVACGERDVYQGRVFGDGEGTGLPSKD